MRRWIAAVVLVACGGSRPATQPTRPATAAVDDLDTGARRVVELAPSRPASGAVARERPARRSIERAEPGVTIRSRSAAPRRREIYRGRRIDLDVKDADLTNLFRFLATVGGVNIVVAPEVRGRVTLRLRHVPWDQIAHVVARAHQLEIERDGDIWLVRKRSGRDPRGQR